MLSGRLENVLESAAYIRNVNSYNVDPASVDVSTLRHFASSAIDLGDAKCHSSSQAIDLVVNQEQVRDENAYKPALNSLGKRPRIDENGAQGLGAVPASDSDLDDVAISDSEMEYVFHSIRPCKFTRRNAGWMRWGLQQPGSPQSLCSSGNDSDAGEEPGDDCEDLDDSEDAPGPARELAAADAADSDSDLDAGPVSDSEEEARIAGRRDGGRCI